MNFDDSLLEKFGNAYIHEHLLCLKEKKEYMSTVLASEVTNKIKDMSQMDLSMDDINLYCSLFEDGRMSIPQNREAGNILLQPLLGQNFGFMKDRCIGAYITSICRDEEALLELKDIIKKDLLSERYLKYIDSLKEKSILETRKGYLKNENMHFITTNIIDIDGTLDYGIAADGKHKFNQHLIDMIVEHPEDDFAICTRRILDRRDRMQVCSELIGICQEILKDEPANKGVEKFMQLIQSGKLKAYSKNDLMNNNQICMAGSITDDEIPQILGIRSLSDATVSKYHSNAVIDDSLWPLWKEIPIDRKITMQQFEDKKMFLSRIEYLRDPKMKFITTELIDQDACFTSSGQLDINIIKVLLHKKDDWVISYVRRNKIMQKIGEFPDNQVLCNFKELLERENKIIDIKNLKNKVMAKEDDFCFVKPIVAQGTIYGGMKSLTDVSISPLARTVPIDPLIQKVYEEVPTERKMTIKQYLGIQQKTTELTNNSPVKEIIARIQTQKQAPVNKKMQQELSNLKIVLKLARDGIEK